MIPCPALVHGLRPIPGPLRMHFLLRTACLLAGLQILLGCSPSIANESSLEAVFEAGDYAAFFAAAKPAADRGEVGALFLLAKAYHLGKGVDTDPDKARSLYQAARERGSARASHNLGIIALDEGLRDEAVALLEEALERGLKLPTYYNLGRAYTPPEPGFPSELLPSADAAGKAGDAYARAYELEGKPGAMTAASREYLRAYMMARKDSHSATDGARLQALRARAVEWLTRGLERGDGAAATNYGVLLLDEKDFAGAVTMLERGALAGNEVAHFHLGRIAEAGLGPSGADRASAIDHYEAAAHLGLELAVEGARRLLIKQLEQESDPDALAAGLARIDRLPGTEDLFSYTKDRLHRRLAWAQTLRSQQQNARQLKSRPLFLRACELDLGQAIGDRLNLGYNLEWRLTATRELGTEEELGIIGRIDKHGCARLEKPLPKSVRTRVEHGEILLLHFPAFSLPLELVDADDSLLLVLPPSAEPAAN